MEQIVTYLLMVQKFTNLKQKILKFVQYVLVGPICLGNILKDWSLDSMKRTGFTGYVYDFSIEYDPVAVDGIKDIHKYLMKKSNIV